MLREYMHYPYDKKVHALSRCWESTCTNYMLREYMYYPYVESTTVE